MWKWLLIVSLLVCLPLVPTIVLAGAEDEITVTATPEYGIESFTIDYVSDTQMDLSWVVSPDVVNVMVRARYSFDLEEIPDEDTEPSGGYLVYYGPDLAVSDTSMDFDTNPGPLYYKLWGQKADGTWFTGSKSNWEESGVMLLLFLGFLAIGTTWLSFWKRNIVLAMGAALSWTTLAILLIVYPDTVHLPGLDATWTQVLAYLFVVMAIGVFLYYLSGIGKTKITMTNAQGQTYQMYGKPTKAPAKSRSQQVKDNHAARLREIGERYSRRRRF